MYVGPVSQRLLGKTSFAPHALEIPRKSLMQIHAADGDGTRSKRTIDYESYSLYGWSMLPELFLSEWLTWERRHELPDGSGIYLVGKGEPPRIVYIGRTWGLGGLRDRLRAFHRSATTGLKGHAGGVTFNRTIGPQTADLSVRVHVPLAINPVEKIVRPYLDYAERRFIWEYVAQHGELPICNSE